MKVITILVLFFIFSSCKNDTKVKAMDDTKTESIALKYAKGFEINSSANSTTLVITKPWPKAEKRYRYLLLTKAQASQKYSSSRSIEFVTIKITHRCIT
jgi:iron complex transport system substrate-binding protein